MPVKRRTAKGAKRLTAEHITMLTEGPDAMLFAGCGYMEDRTAGVYWRADDAERAEIDAAMRDDWVKHGAQLLAEHPDKTPWAMTAYGPPAN